MFNIGLPDMLVREEEADGKLLALHLYYPTTGPAPTRVIMHSLLDIHGDERFMIPATKDDTINDVMMSCEKFTKRVTEFKPSFDAMNMMQYPYPIKNATARQYSSMYQSMDVTEIQQAHPPVYTEATP